MNTILIGLISTVMIVAVTCFTLIFLFNFYQKRKVRQQALKELDDVIETVTELLKETSHTRCGFDSAMEVLTEQYEIIKKGIK